MAMANRRQRSKDEEPGPAATAAEGEVMTLIEYRRWLVRQENMATAAAVRQQVKVGDNFRKAQMIESDACNQPTQFSDNGGGGGRAGWTYSVFTDARCGSVGAVGRDATRGVEGAGGLVGVCQTWLFAFY